MITEDLLKFTRQTTTLDNLNELPQLMQSSVELFFRVNFPGRMLVISINGQMILSPMNLNRLVEFLA